MASVYRSVEQLIGHTPLVELGRVMKNEGLSARLLAKLEMRNPAGSVKDRVAKAMVDDAEEKGLLKPGAVIIEPTSGNTGIGLCAIAALRGYRCIIVMPASMSRERQLLMKAYGAEVVLSPAAHYASTGPEIWADTDGSIDIFVAGAGTGGTVTGCSRFLKQQNPNIQIIAAEPADSPVLSGGKAGKHGIQGIGAGFVPEILDMSVIDEVVTVKDADAFAAARMIARSEAILTGISSGAALHAAISLAKRPENAGKTIVVLLPDSGERYLSTSLYE